MAEDIKTIEKQERFRRKVWKAAIRLVPLLFRRPKLAIEPIGIDPPYLLIANHACNSDPILLGFASPSEPLVYVASEHLERLGWLTKVLKKCFSFIPRKKATVAVETVRGIRNSLKEGHPVVLFAEGDCTWDGRTAKVFPSTGKLAKTMHVPLVTYRLEGNYLYKPRWARKARRGQVAGRVIHIYDEAETKLLSGEELTEKIDKDIFVDMVESAQESGAVYAGKGLAEGLEQALFICPKCHKTGTLYTRGNGIFCKDCGPLGTVDVHGALEDGPFPTVHEWDVWQQEELSRMREEPPAEPLFPAEGTWTDVEEGTEQKVRFFMDLKEKCLMVGEKALPFEQIQGMSMVKTNRLLVSCPEGYYELKTKQGILRPYLLAWQMDAKKREEK